MKKSALASKLAAAACALALVATPAVAIAQPATTSDTPIVAQSYLADHDYTAAYYTAINSLGLTDDEVDLRVLETYYDEDGFLVDHVGFTAYGVRYDFEVEHYSCSFYSATYYNL
jgi:ABC-type sugar transport system substrate-binding protein